ncbi:MAG: hypothetical protein K2Q10_08105, partial [Rhodospirillales bacterium]|nr:hypothetical protein [Rhodospirillales bacterium]
MAAALVIATLLWPALWNGFPLVFHDTGAYLAYVHRSGLEPGRGPLYGWFIALFYRPSASLWPVLVAQSGLLVWLLRLELRSHGIRGGRPLLLLGLALAAVTPLPWYASMLMPDIFTPMLVLGWHLMVFHRRRMSTRERWAVAALTVLATAVHMSHLALILGLALATALVPVCRRRLTGLPMAVLAASLLAIPAINGFSAGHWGFTPGGQAFVFGRLVQDGIVTRFLAEHCPSPAYRLCDWRNRLPATGDEWLWSDASPFRKLGAWEGLNEEMGRIARESLAAYPAQHLSTALWASLHQFGRFA